MPQDDYPPSSAIRIGQIGKWVIGWPRVHKRLVLLVIDVLLCVGTVRSAFYLRLGTWDVTGMNVWLPTIASILIAIPIFIRSGLYRAIIRHTGWSALSTMAGAIAIYSIPFSIVFTFVGVAGVPRTIGLLQPILLLLFVGGLRAFGRAWLGDHYMKLRQQAAKPKIMIFGAGQAGRQLLRAVEEQIKVEGFIDDDPKLQGATMHGVPIYSLERAHEVLETRQIKQVLLAIPSASRRRKIETAEIIRSWGIKVLAPPAMTDIASGKVTTSDLRKIEIEDLLGREAIAPVKSLMRANIKDRVVLVTGAGGSIGQELCRQIIASNPQRLIVLDFNEFGVYSMQQQLEKLAASKGIGVEIMPIIGSVCEKENIEEVFAIFKPDTVFHAAAYKHVPLVESNVLAGVANNVFGTLNTVQAAIKHGVGSFTLVSTDKAVRPTNIMGASKRVSELILQALAAEGGQKTTLSMVRFGNVLGSSGSVVPLFKEQIGNGGPITITDARITRYFMTIPEAAQLVVQANAMAGGGDVFLLDMGKPIKIIELAKNMVKLAGLTIRDSDRPEGDIEIVEVGLRPGEKLFEELLIGAQDLPTDHQRIFRAKESFLSWADLSKMLEMLEQTIAKRDADSARAILQELVPEFEPSSPLSDLRTHHAAKVL